MANSSNQIKKAVLVITQRKCKCNKVMQCLLVFVCVYTVLVHKDKNTSPHGICCVYFRVSTNF